MYCCWFGALNVNAGSYNTALGCDALGTNTTGINNTAIGTSALQRIVTGTNNIAVGIYAGNGYTGEESNNILIGNTGVAGEINKIRIGNILHTGGAYMPFRVGTTLNIDAVFNNLLYNYTTQEIVQKSSYIFLPNAIYDTQNTAILGGAGNNEGDAKQGSLITNNIFADTLIVNIGGRFNVDSKVWLPQANQNHIGSRLVIFTNGGGGGLRTYARIANGWAIRHKYAYWANVYVASEGGLMICTYVGNNVWQVDGVLA